LNEGSLAIPPQKEIEMSKITKVLVIGSGPIVIGQAAEFDYAGTRNPFLGDVYAQAH